MTKIEGDILIVTATAKTTTTTGPPGVEGGEKNETSEDGIDEGFIPAPIGRSMS